MLRRTPRTKNRNQNKPPGKQDSTQRVRCAKFLIPPVPTQRRIKKALFERKEVQRL